MLDRRPRRTEGQGRLVAPVAFCAAALALAACGDEADEGDDRAAVRIAFDEVAYVDAATPTPKLLERVHRQTESVLFALHTADVTVTRRKLVDVDLAHLKKEPVTVVDASGDHLGRRAAAPLPSSRRARRRAPGRDRGQGRAQASARSTPPPRRRPRSSARPAPRTGSTSATPIPGRSSTPPSSAAAWPSRRSRRRSTWRASRSRARRPRSSRRSSSGSTWPVSVRLIPRQAPGRRRAPPRPTPPVARLRTRKTPRGAALPSLPGDDDEPGDDDDDDEAEALAGGSGPSTLRPPRARQRRAPLPGRAATWRPTGPCSTSRSRR